MICKIELSICFIFFILKSNHGVDHNVLEMLCLSQILNATEALAKTMCALGQLIYRVLYMTEKENNF